jgi:hypothetical protein
VRLRTWDPSDAPGSHVCWKLDMQEENEGKKSLLSRETISMMGDSRGVSLLFRCSNGQLKE